VNFRTSFLRSRRLALIVSLMVFSTFLPGFVALQQSASATPTNYSLFSDYVPSATPVFDNPTELGISASTTSAGQITAIRFYQYWNGTSGNNGAHVGYVWSGRRGDPSNTLLATKTFPVSTNTPTSSGWVEVTLDSPISIAANTNFTVSVSNQNGYYTRDSNPASKTVGPLSFLGTSYHYRNNGSFPNENSGTNYGIDFVFSSDTSTVNCSTSGTFTIVSNEVTTNSSCTGSATIPSGVTSIAANAFYQAFGLTGVTIPSTVTSIGTNAFFDTNLVTVNIPSSVTSMGNGVFQDVGTLTNATFENGIGITAIPAYTFLWANSLNSVTIPEGITTIGISAFAVTSALRSITLPDTIAVISNQAFEASGITSITIPNVPAYPNRITQLGNYWPTGLTVTYCGTNSYVTTFSFSGRYSTCVTAPNAPTSLSATAGNTTATISFTAGSNGGSAITNYKYSTNGTTYTALSPADTTSPVTISGLTNGTSYTIYLKAVNAIGDSVASSSVSVSPAGPADEPACNAACQAAASAAKAKADADAAALAAKKAADAKAKQDALDLAANIERVRVAAEQARQAQMVRDQAEKDRLAAEKALLPPAQQAIVEQRSEAFNAFIAELPPIVPVEDLALISSREDLPQYDPASEPEKNSAAQVAGFAAVSVLAAGGAATAMSGGSSSGSSGGGSSSGGGAARTASASVARREEEMASNKSLLEEIDHLSLKRKQDNVIAKIKPGPGDNSFTWRLPYTQKVEDYFYVTSQKANRFVPLMAKLFADAAYLRAMIGSLSLITFPLAILLGLNALQDVENQALPPTWIVIATIAGLGLIDAFAGFLVSFIYVAGILMAGNLTTLPEILTVLGTTSLFFTPALVATSFRPLRRYTLNWDHRLERIGDYLIASVLTGWTLSKIIATFNVLAGVQLAIVADANKVGIAIGFFVFIRMFAEDMATYFYPQRLGKNVIEFGAPGKVQQLFSLVGKSFMFLLVTQSFVGLNLQLIIGTIFFAIPILIKIVMGNRLPKIKYFNYILPKGTIRLIVMTISGTLCAEFSSQFFANPRDLLTWGFVILSVPGLVFSMMGLFADESHKLDWKKTNPGKLVYLAGALVVFYLLSQIALNKNLLVIFQGLLS